jgi:DNA-binding MarR family transcriptional regulator
MRKFRGEPFDKVAFCIETVELPQYINKLTGKPMTTAIARYLPPKEEEAIEEMIGERQFKVLKHIHQHPDASMRGRILDFEAGFAGNVMKISAATLSRDIAQLKEMEYIKKAVRGFELTRRGKAAVEPKGEHP